MASPQLENGHLRIAYEVWEHLMSSGLLGAEILIVMAVIRQTWGWKKKEAEISLAEFCAMTLQPERTVVRALNSLKAKKLLIHTPGGGRGKWSKWSFNKDWESWEKTLPLMTEKNALENPSAKNSAIQNRVLNGGQTPPSVVINSAMDGGVSDCNLLQELEWWSPKEIYKEKKAIQASSKPAQRDEAYDYFAKLFEEKTCTPYLKSKGDFPQLAALRKSFKIGPHDMPPDWEMACRNYLDSAMGSYSIAWMVTGNRYAVLRKFKLNKFGKPDADHNGNGTGRRDREDNNLQVIRQVQQAQMEAKHGS
jgi:phage replication O-like protein O